MIGYLVAIIIGASLGLLGGGGSILTVPVLVYLLKMDPKTSIALSLAIVGTTSLVGVFSHFRNGNVSFKTIKVFAPITMLGAFLGAKVAAFIPGNVQLIIFGVIMLASSTLMIKGRQNLEETQGSDTSLMALGLSGLAVGLISGIVGVGGGFLIVPALVLLARLPMKQAVGTSLAVISLSSLTGFVGYVGAIEIPWGFLATFIGLSSVGIVIGTKLVSYISQQKLKKGFGYFLIVMAVFVLYKNIA